MYESKLRGDEMDALFRAVLTLESGEDCYRFFEDLCTIGELQAMSQRFAVARALRRGETYAAIAEKTGASTATISRVNRCLVYGAAGYRDALTRLGE